MFKECNPNVPVKLKLQQRNLNTNFLKIQMPGGLPGVGGMLKFRFDRYIILRGLALPSVFHAEKFENLWRPDCHIATPVTN